MTSQLAILNRTGVALASDSAVTMDAGRQYTGLDKIFSLGGKHQVGFMIAGVSEYLPCGVEWERIVWLWSQRIQDEPYDTLDQYIVEFIDFVENNSEGLLDPNHENEMSLFSDLNKFCDSVLLEKWLVTV